ncbi:hypothetical protein [Xylella fastidiosa]|nr:hypothetical protein [Xylella fastidiosa]
MTLGVTGDKRHRRAPMLNMATDDWSVSVILGAASAKDGVIARVWN